MGMLYYGGKGVPQDYTKAIEYFKKAANQGNANALLLKNLPKNTIKNNQETYELSCPNNSQHTTEDMANCVCTMIKQLESIQNKYIMTINSNINLQYSVDDPDPDLLKETLTSFDEENKAWDKLFKEASNATYSYNEHGSMRGLVANTRRLELMKYRIHNQWRNWLIFTDTVSEYKPPEPIFKINY